MTGIAEWIYLFRVAQARMMELLISIDGDTILYVFQVPLTHSNIRRNSYLAPFYVGASIPTNAIHA